MLRLVQGAVKVTPAHDPTDFEIGMRHDSATHSGDWLRWHYDRRRLVLMLVLDRFEARKQAGGRSYSSRVW